MRAIYTMSSSMGIGRDWPFVPKSCAHAPSEQFSPSIALQLRKRKSTIQIYLMLKQQLLRQLLILGIVSRDCENRFARNLASCQGT